MIESHDFLKFIKSRRSIKRLKPDSISRKVIEEILDVAISAPSAHNAQPWRFIIIDDQKVKIKLAEAMAQAWQEDLLKDGLSRIEIERIIDVSK
ncbi:MAG: nitroreductase family protein [archaeon]|nr:nitroreductase family protein [archaeon]MCP8319432.1 nitroreductase family protein [archaeon]